MATRRKSSSGKNFKSMSYVKKKSKKAPVTIVTTIVVVVMTLLGWTNKEFLMEYLFSEYGIFGSETSYGNELEGYTFVNMDEILAMVDMGEEKVGCDCGSQSLERRQAAFLLAAAELDVAKYLLHAFAEAANLNEAGLDREIQTHANQQDDQDVIRKIGICLCYDV